jgi:hypothetical protein
VAASVVIFLLIEIVPGDPAQFMLGLNATPELADALREQLGLNGPPVQRYFTWVLGLLHGDLGISYGYKVPVADLVADRIWISLPLAIYALALSTIIAFPVGILAQLETVPGVGKAGCGRLCSVRARPHRAYRRSLHGCARLTGCAEFRTRRNEPWQCSALKENIAFAAERSSAATCSISGSAHSSSVSSG